MRKIFFLTFILTIPLITLFSQYSYARMVLHDFEEDAQGWAIPRWSCEKNDYSCKVVNISHDVASLGKGSLKLEVDFKKDSWYAAVTEVEGPFDLSKYKTIACDVFLPEGAPEGIEARIALSVGENWLWIETEDPVELVPNKWVTIKAGLRSGSNDWKTVEMIERMGKDGKFRGNVKHEYNVPMTDAYRADVRTIAVRAEAYRVDYRGPIYVDNMRVQE